MIDIRAVSRYARALYELSEKKQELDSIDDQFLALSQTVQKHPEIGRLVSNFTITQKEKESFVEKIFGASLNPLLIQFLKVLIKRHRFAELIAIQEEFHRLYERKRRVEEVIVISPIPLSDENATRLKVVLGEKLKTDINLIKKVNRKLIGGLIIRYGGNEINASFRSRLDQLHQNLYV